MLTKQKALATKTNKYHYHKTPVAQKNIAEFFDQSTSKKLPQKDELNEKGDSQEAALPLS